MCNYSNVLNAIRVMTTAEEARNVSQTIVADTRTIRYLATRFVVEVKKDIEKDSSVNDIIVKYDLSDSTDNSLVSVLEFCDTIGYKFDEHPEAFKVGSIKRIKTALAGGLNRYFDFAFLYENVGNKTLQTFSEMCKQAGEDKELKLKMIREFLKTINAKGCTSIDNSLKLCTDTKKILEADIRKMKAEAKKAEAKRMRDEAEAKKAEAEKKEAEAEAMPEAIYEHTSDYHTPEGHIDPIQAEKEKAEAEKREAEEEAKTSVSFADDVNKDDITCINIEGRRIEFNTREFLSQIENIKKLVPSLTIE